MLTEHLPRHSELLLLLASWQIAFQDYYVTDLRGFWVYSIEL